MPVTEENRAKLKLFSATEVADILKMNAQVISRKLSSGELEGYKLGKDWRVSEEQLLRFLDKHSNARAQLGEAEKVVDSFFEGERLKEIPASQKKRLHILRHLVAKLDPRKIYSEQELSDFLRTYHSDFCTLRREFIANKLMVRKDGKYKVIGWNTPEASQ